MPFLSITTNVDLTPETTRALLERGTALVVEALGKPEKFVQVRVEPGQHMVFAGSNEPTAFVEMRSLGFPAGGTAPVSERICGLLEEDIGIPPDRVFINFIDVERPMWGWNGTTLG